MFTRCPHCSTFFAVSAEQLGAAQGRVRCGSCMSIFDGLEHLSDEPPPSPTEDGGDDERGLDSQTAASEEEIEVWLQDRDPTDAAEDIDDDHVGKPGPPTLEGGDDPAEEADDAEPVPEAIQEDLDRAEAERRGRWKSALLTGIALLLLLLLGLQHAWFKPAEVLAGYPQARPWLEKFCAFSGCRVPDRRKPSKIQMLARDVRVHPRFEGALLVSATLVNVAPQAQPYPRLQFSVFNVNGETVASRVFEPGEYLSQDLDAEGDMLPGKPLQIALELLAPGEAAVSYEFQFL